MPESLRYSTYVGSTRQVEQSATTREENNDLNVIQTDLGLQALHAWTFVLIRMWLRLVGQDS